MKEFENINTSLPYSESTDYVENLLRRCKENAEGKEDVRKFVFARPFIYTLAGMAAAAAVVMGTILLTSRETIIQESPMNSFLASLTDSEAEMITDWQIEDITESL